MVGVVGFFTEMHSTMFFFVYNPIVGLIIKRIHFNCYLITECTLLCSRSAKVNPHVLFFDGKYMGISNNPLMFIHDFTFYIRCKKFSFCFFFFSFWYLPFLETLLYVCVYVYEILIYSLCCFLKVPSFLKKLDLIPITSV